MTTGMTPGAAAAADDLTGYAGRAWAWYLTGGKIGRASCRERV